jgi:hypothetical protein
MSTFIKEVVNMKIGKIFVMTLFALLVLGIVFVAAQESRMAVADTEGEVFGVQPMASCTRICSWCVKLGRGGICTTSGACC